MSFWSKFPICFSSFYTRFSKDINENQVLFPWQQLNKTSKAVISLCKTLPSYILLWCSHLEYWSVLERKPFFFLIRMCFFWMCNMIAMSVMIRDPSFAEQLQQARLSKALFRTNQKIKLFHHILQLFPFIVKLHVCSSKSVINSISTSELSSSLGNWHYGDILNFLVSRHRLCPILFFEFL